jgi:hypothetical protein
MEKCANCDVDAKYVVNHPVSTRQVFCSQHLPVFLRNNDPEYLHPYVSVLADEVKPKPKRAKKAAAPAPVEEETVEAEIADESTEDSN